MAIVLGAGPRGLRVAESLARRGVRVSVFEPGSVPVHTTDVVIDTMPGHHAFEIPRRCSGYLRTVTGPLRTDVSWSGARGTAENARGSESK